MDSNGPKQLPFWVFLPKSLLLLSSRFLIYDFHSTFDRCLKVRLFARHNGEYSIIGPILHIWFWPDCWVITSASPFVKSWVRNRAYLVSTYAQHSIGSIDHAVINLVRCQHWHASCVGFVSLSLPNEDLGRIDKRGNPDFEGSTFQGSEYSICATNHFEKYIENLDFIFCSSFQSGFPLLSILPKSSFGRDKKSVFHLLFLLPKSSFGWGRVISLAIWDANAFSHHTTCPGRPQTHETI